MATSGPVAESPIESALRLANDAVEHAVAIAVRTGRPRDHMKTARLLESAPDAVDHLKLEEILGRHGLLDFWRRLRPAL